MYRVPPTIIKRSFLRCLLVFAVLSLAVPLAVRTQGVADKVNIDLGPEFRVEKVTVAGGAEIITIFAKSTSFKAVDNPAGEVPLISVLRDTLGDNIVENDHLRNVWMLTQTNPTMTQKLASAIPFFYRRVASKTDAGTGLPKSIIDLHGKKGSILFSRTVFDLFNKYILSRVSLKAHAVIGQFLKNSDDYKHAGIEEASIILSQFENAPGDKLFSDQELQEIQARIWLTKKPFGGGLQSSNLRRSFEHQWLDDRANRGQTRELLRRFTEQGGLYFDPLKLTDGQTRHGMIWIAAEDLEANKGRPFERRFLNIKDPWDDKRLIGWKGYSEERWYDENSRIVPAGTPGATKKTLIPLAVYGLDHARIPIILVDFRDVGNPRHREMTGRLINDISSDVLSMGRYGKTAYTVGRQLFNFATGRRAMDMNQPSRVGSYAELKMMLALDTSLTSELRNEIAAKLEKVSFNPLQNDLAAEITLARQQYKNLMDYAQRPDGLTARLEKERNDEAISVAREAKSGIGTTIAKLLTLGFYKPSVKLTPDLRSKMDLKRQQDFHERVIRETVFWSQRPEVDYDTVALSKAMQFMSEHDTNAGAKTTQALVRIFNISNQEDLKSGALASLYKINNAAAKNSLLAIYKDPKLDAHWREICAKYLKKALAEKQRISGRDAAAISGIGTN